MVPLTVINFTICYLHKSADVIHGDVGEPEGFSFGHATAGYLGYDINNFAAHLRDGLLTPQHGTEVNVHVVLHHAVGALVGSHLQHGSDGVTRRGAPTCCEDDSLTARSHHRRDTGDVETSSVHHDGTFP